MMGRTMYINVEGSMNALATPSIRSGRPTSLVAAVGRTVFRIYCIEDDKFVEKHNLRVGRNLNLNYSSNDVDWHPTDDNILATAATNGSVVTWNLSKRGKQKVDTVFTKHTRTVNRVQFNPNEPNWLLSGAQDGVKCVDIRAADIAVTFTSNNENVHDVCFNPHTSGQFIAAIGMNISLYDFRNPLKSIKSFPAHNEPVFSCDWHMEEAQWIATAGRDKIIKIWELGDVQCMQTIQTIEPVRRIKWRPGRRNHIASCGSQIDFSISIWDIRRPYIPLAAFEQHSDVPTGVVWCNDTTVFLSGGKDSMLYQHAFKDAKKPAENAPPIGLDMSIYGDISHALSTQQESSSRRKETISYAHTRVPAFFRKLPDDDTISKYTSSVNMYENKQCEVISMDWFIKSAERYQLSGRSLAELCDHNAAVAIELDRVQVANTWEMLKVFYTNYNDRMSLETSSGVNSSGLSLKNSTCSVLLQRALEHKEENHKQKVTEGGVKLDEDVTKDTDDQEESEVSDLEHDKMNALLSSAYSSHHAGDLFETNFYFGEGEGEAGLVEENYDDVYEKKDYVLPNEGIQLRHDIMDRTTTGELMDRGTDMPNGNLDSVDTNPHQCTVDDIDLKPVFKLTATLISEWDFRSTVVNMLHDYVDQGDVQMAVSVLIVLGSKIRKHIEERTQICWFHCYIDMLSTFSLWCVSTEVIRHSQLSNILALNQQSTTIHTNCNICNKIIPNKGHYCDKCQLLTNSCSICHLPVRSMYVWCQGCSHGGHLQHLDNWFSKYTYCPTGCGHKCKNTDRS